VLASLPSRRGKIVKSARSGFLYATPSFISGAARVLDLYGTFDKYNSSATEREADYKAIWADWSVVGHDIFDAMRQVADTFPHCISDSEDDRPSVDERQMNFFE
jgi:hypothetical protein